MATVLPAKLAGVRSMNEPLFTADQDVNRIKWQKLNAMGISAVEFQTREIRVWLKDGVRCDYGKAEKPSAVAQWMHKQGVKVFGPLCPEAIRESVVHAGGEPGSMEHKFILAAQAAMERNGRLTIRYHSRSKDEDTEREITPIRWSELGLVAHCHMRNEERTFVANRVIEFKENN
jgi:hypothetical protein